jgi:cation diffusion facilitator family transporter
VVLERIVPTSSLDRRSRAALGSIGVGTVVFAMKMAAFLLTGSIALYSDALESIINIVAGIAALVALQVSARPADANHPFGHHKAEYFSAVIEGVLIVLAALAILRESYHGLIDPPALEAAPLGLAITSGATAINGAWCWYLIRNGRRWRSPALIADGKHLLADVATSVGVVVGVALVAVTGIAILDPLLAAAVALNILWSGYVLVRSSLSGLMDEAAAPEVLERIRGAIAASGEGAIEAHDLRTRHAGRTTFIDFHLVVPGEMKVREAHEICDRIEAALRADIEDAAIVIHVEPQEKAKHSGLLVL